MEYYGDENEESIYKAVPKEIAPPVKPPRHKSVHNPKLPPTSSTFGLAQTGKPGVQNMAGKNDENSSSAHDYVKPHAVMGPPLGTSKLDPTKFSMDESKRKPKVQSAAEVRKNNPELLKPTTLKTKLKPGVPTQDDKPVMNLASDKNFIVANAVEVILAAPKKAGEKEVDWKAKKDYGEVPKYINKIKKDISDEYDYIQAIHQEEEESRSNKIQCMSQEKKEELIEGLKAKWEQTNRDYQATTHLTKLDTINKVKRKEQNEAELAQLEKYIQKLTKSSIYVDPTK